MTCYVTRTCMIGLSCDLQEPPGTEYVVMECIVMEGGDDVTLEPGEVVELVRVEPGGSVLRVRTKDDPPVEGKILASYLRKKDSVRGLKMEGERWWEHGMTFSGGEVVQCVIEASNLCASQVFRGANHFYSTLL